MLEKYESNFDKLIKSDSGLFLKISLNGSVLFERFVNMHVNVAFCGVNLIILYECWRFVYYVLCNNVYMLRLSLHF